jgi:translation initiation factor 6
LDFNGNPYVGVYAAANDQVLVVGPEVPRRTARAMADALEVRLVETTLAGSSVVGSLVAMNSTGAVVSGLAEAPELTRLGILRVKLIHHRLNAAGNNVLCNDAGAIVHPGFDDATVREVSAVLGVPVERGTVAGVRTVGSAAVATNKGVLCHPHATEEEMALLKDVLRVPARTTTANYGTAQVGACVVANTRGAIIGSRTTPIEMGRIEEGLGYL